MNLIRRIDLDDLNKRKKQITYIREQIQRATNKDLYKKIDLLQAFLDLLEDGIDGNDIEQTYEEFITKQRQKDIDDFLAENTMDRDMLIGFISEYEFSYILDEGEIRDSLTEITGLLKKKAMVRKIVEFIKLFAEKYQ
jgi:type I restriction enzyme R subunit